jgi:hypothetical protein
MTRDEAETDGDNQGHRSQRERAGTRQHERQPESDTATRRRSTGARESAVLLSARVVHDGLAG